MGYWTSLSRWVIKEGKVTLKDEANETIRLNVEGLWDVLDVDR